MKIIITASGNDINQPFNPRFGRCETFIVFDTETRESEAIANPAAEAQGGAGPMAVQAISNLDAQVIISGRYGPSAYTALEAAGLQAFLAQSGTVAEVADQYLAGKLEQVSGATGKGMHGR